MLLIERKPSNIRAWKQIPRNIKNAKKCQTNNNQITKMNCESILKHNLDVQGSFGACAAYRTMSKHRKHEHVVIFWQDLFIFQLFVEHVPVD